MRFLTSIFILSTILVANNGKTVTVDKDEKLNETRVYDKLKNMGKMVVNHFKEEAKELYDYLKISGHLDKVNHVAKKVFDKLKVGGHLDKVKEVAKDIYDKLKTDHAETKKANKSEHAFAIGWPL